jgi:CRISPR type IV-associated protein Csf3
MRPLRVTAYLCSPLCGDPPMLDALLESEMAPYMRSVQRTSGGGHHVAELRPTRRDAAPPGCRMPIGLDWARLGDWAVWRASSPIMAEPTAEYVEHVSKRLDTDRVELVDSARLRKLAVATGALKSYHLPQRIRSVSSVRWFCVGRGHEVRRFASRVAAIGQKTAYGYGRVARWDVEETSEDLSWIAQGPDGQRVLMRPMPRSALVEQPAGARGAFGACQSPYWHPANQTEIWTPC